MKVEQHLLYQWEENRGGARNFPTGGLNLPTRGLKYGFQGIVIPKYLQQIFFHLPTGASMFRQGAISPSSPPLAPPLERRTLWLSWCMAEKSVNFYYFQMDEIVAQFQMMLKLRSSKLEFEALLKFSSFCKDTFLSLTNK